jgi:hypothetical protein
VNSVLVAVTAVLVGITVRQVRLTRKALELTRDAVVATQKEADATAASVKEAVRARVDQRAPRVVVRQVDRDPHVWYPSTVGGKPNPATQAHQVVFELPRQNLQAMFVRADLHLRNEGLSSAWVSCSDIDFLAWPASSVARAFFTSQFPGDPRMGWVEGTMIDQDLGPGPLFLEAGSDLRCRLRIELECPVGTWLDRSPVEAELTIRVADSQEPGVEDVIPVVVRASPFVIDTNTGKAVARQGILDQEPYPPLVECTVMRSRRRYQGEGLLT